MAQQPLKLASGLTSPAASITNSTAATNTTTGALIVTGGVGIGGSTFIGGSATVGQDLTVTGNLTVNGTTTTINTVNVTVDDILLELGAVASPTDTTANGGGIALKGATDKTITWVQSTAAWTSSENLNLVTGKTYQINGTTVLNATTLGSGITNSSLTSVGTIGTGTWQGNVVGLAYGGTNKNLTPVNGGIVWTDADSMEVTAAGSAGQLLQSNGAGAPSWTNASALSVGTATNATNATNTMISDDSSTTTGYVTWVSGPSGANGQKVTLTKLTFNASTGNLSSTQFNSLTLTASAGSGFSIAGGTTSKTLSVNETITLTSSAAGGTLNIGTGGTLGSAAFTAASAYEPAFTTLPVTKGGTGTGTNPTANGVIYASSSVAYTSTAAGTTGQVLSGVTSGAPAWTNASALSVATATNATTAASTTLIDDTTTTTGYISWVNATSGSVAQRITSTRLTFNASNGNLAATTFNSLTLTASAGAGFTIAGGGTSKTLTVGETITLTSSAAGGTLNIGTGGTLGSAAFTAASAYEPAITTLAVTKGGTGTGVNPTAGGVIWGSSSVAFGSTAAGTAGQLLQSNGTSAPSWTNASALSAGSATYATTAGTATTATNLSGGTVSAVAAAPTGTTHNNAAVLGFTGANSASIAMAAVGRVTASVNTQIVADTWSTTTYKAVEYTVYIVQGTKYRVSKVVGLSDGTSADSTEYAIIERGGAISGVDVQVTMSGSNAQLAVTITDAATTNAEIRAFRTILG